MMKKKTKVRRFFGKIRRFSRLCDGAAGAAGGFLCGLCGSGGGTLTLLLLRRLHPEWEERTRLLFTLAVLYPAVAAATVFSFWRGMLPPTPSLLPLALPAAVGGFLGCRLARTLKGNTLRLLLGGMLFLGGALLLCG